MAKRQETTVEDLPMGEGSPEATNGTPAVGPPPAEPAPLADAFATWLRLKAESDAAEAVVREALAKKGAVNNRTYQNDGKLYTVKRVEGAKRVVEVAPIL